MNLKIKPYPSIDCKTGKIETIYPKVRKINGAIQPIGVCYVDGESLDCYDWEADDYLIIYGALPASDEYIPEEQYYVFNINKDYSGAWVNESQVKFEIHSVIDDFIYKLPKRINFDELVDIN